MADSLIALLVKDLQIPAFFKKEFNIPCCIRGYHTHQTQWNADIGARLPIPPETRPATQDKSAIAVINNRKTVGHIPKLLTKLTLFFLKMVINYTLQ